MRNMRSLVVVVFVCIIVIFLYGLVASPIMQYLCDAMPR